ncbi:MAG: hypothetical protein KF845_13140 [Cyclobacteriaceae bacterium]|nr:hypothetical protein [Cyclobacteriaceae bacterium]
MIKLAIALLTTTFADTTTSLEQKACDHFFSDIFRKEYAGYKVVEFDNQTDTAKYWGIVYGCKNWDEKTKEQIVSATPDKSTVVTVSLNDLKIKKMRTNSNRLKIHVSSKIRVGNNYFVLIGTYRKLRFAEYFYVELDHAGNIIGTCKKGEII